MHKFMLIPAFAFVLVLLLAFHLSMNPAPPTDPPAPTDAPADVPAATAAETVPSPELPPMQEVSSLTRTAFPLLFSDKEYFENLLAPITNEDPPNDELHDYVPQQVDIDDKFVRITAELRDGHYYSGRAESLLAFRYGTMTFRINCMDNPGLFPAVWMLPANGALYPEIDIYEHIGREPQYFYGVNHYLVTDGFSSYTTNENFLHTSPRSNLPEDYIITFEWTPEHLRWQLNGETIYTMVDHIPDEPMFLIINLAVGGNWCGHPTVVSTFPAVMEVEFLDFRPQELYTR